MTQAYAVAPADSQIQLEPHERQLCEVWTRVMGYHRPVASFNPGKQGEYAERLFYCEARAVPCLAA
ncbi:MAG: hypothetical protein HY255_10730 [Betaproteobacteria bacterium]|nr:hypothetical protein [Betaproteobacteria bacterium]